MMSRENSTPLTETLQNEWLIKISSSMEQKADNIGNKQVDNDDPWRAAKHGNLEAILWFADQHLSGQNMEDVLKYASYYTCLSGVAFRKKGMAMLHLLLDLWAGDINPMVMV